MPFQIPQKLLNPLYNEIKDTLESKAENERCLSILRNDRIEDKYFFNYILAL